VRRRRAGRACGTRRATRRDGSSSGRRQTQGRAGVASAPGCCCPRPRQGHHACAHACAASDRAAAAPALRSAPPGRGAAAARPAPGGAPPPRPPAAAAAPFTGVGPFLEAPSGCPLISGLCVRWAAAVDACARTSRWGERGKRCGARTARAANHHGWYRSAPPAPRQQTPQRKSKSAPLARWR
jgi:hypothetical protein